MTIGAIKWHVRWYLTSKGDQLWRQMAWWLPRRLVMWAAIRLIAHATAGPHSTAEVPALGAMEALRRWDLP